MGFWSQATPALCCDVVESHHGSPTRALNLEPQDLARSQIKASNVSEPQVSPLWNLKINACLSARPTNLMGYHWGRMAWEQVEVLRHTFIPPGQASVLVLPPPQSALPGAPPSSLQLRVSAYLASHLLAQLTTPFFSNPLSLGCCDTTLAPILCPGSSAHSPSRTLQVPWNTLQGCLLAVLSLEATIPNDSWDSVSYPLLLLRNIPWYGFTTVCFAFHPLKGIWIVSSLERVQFLGHICMFSFFKKLSSCLPEQLDHFTFPPATCKWFSFSTASLAFGVIVIFYFSHSDKFMLISHCGSHLHFTNG